MAHFVRDVLLILLWAACTACEVPPPRRPAPPARARVDLPLPLHSWRRHVIDSDRPGRAVFIAAADLNGDGWPEVITGRYLYFRNADSGWVRRTAGGGLTNMAAVADLNGDGHLDVLGTVSGRGEDPYGARMVIRSGLGDGRFGSGARVAAGPGDFLQGVATAHFDNGPLPQVALSWHGDSVGVQLLAQGTDGVWRRETISPHSQDEQLSAADLDGDGRIDLVQGTRWLRNAANGWAQFTIDTSPEAPDRNRVADIDGDGVPDVVVGFEAISRPGPVRWYRRVPGPPERWERNEIAIVTGPMSLDAGDLDGDGDVDLVVGEHNLVSPASARLLLLENRGGGDSWQVHEIFRGDEHHDGTVLVDMDGDGDLDVLSIGWGHQLVLWYENLAIP